MATLSLSAIYVYPVKSLSGIRLERSKVEKKGLALDRRWAIVSPDGRCITQRTHPHLALVSVEIEKNCLVLWHREDPEDALEVPFESETTDFMPVNVWGDVCLGHMVGAYADEWLADLLGIEGHLVHMPKRIERVVDSRYTEERELVSFADGFPFMVMGEASLEELNSQLDDEVDALQFRPNLVFRGGVAHVEDSWKRFRVGDLVFRGVKPCVRDGVLEVDQQTGEKVLEPMETLGDYRRFGEHVLFGQNLLVESEGEIRVGDMITVLETGDLNGLVL